MSKKINIAALLVLALYLLPLAQSIGTIGAYLNNLNYISNELCINRATPQMHCEGTCVLAQMMNDENKIPRSPFDSSENSIKITEVLAFLFYDCANTVLVTHSSKALSSFYLSFYNYQLVSCLEWPPENWVYKT